MAWVKKHWVGVTLVAILLVAAFMRLWQLDRLPPGLHPDEAANGLDIISMFQHYNFQVLYDTNGPREALFFYLQAIFVLGLGYTQLALRLAPALIGLFTVWVTYLFVKEIWGKYAALISSFLVATSAWHMTITRDGFRASMTPLMEVGTLYFYARGFKYGKRRDFILAGVVLGLGMYTYLAFRLFPLVFVVMIAWAAIWQRKLIKQWYRQVILSWIVALIVFVPMAIFAVKHPDAFGARAGGVSILNPSVSKGHPIELLGSNIYKTALMFTVEGDHNSRQNLPPLPQLGPAEGLFFIIGLLFFLSRINKPEYLLVLAVFGVMLLPEVLTGEGIPHGLRAIGAIPWIEIMGGVAAVWLITRFFKTFPRNQYARWAVFAVVALTALASIWYSYQRYFVVWGQDPRTFEAYSRDAVDIAVDVKHHKTTTNYVVIDGYSNKTVTFLTQKTAVYTWVEPKTVQDLALAPGHYSLWFGTHQQPDLDRFKQAHPGGTEYDHTAVYSGKTDFIRYDLDIK